MKALIAYTFAILVGVSIGLWATGTDGAVTVGIIAGGWLLFGCGILVPLAWIIRGVREERAQARRGKAARARMDWRRHRGT